MEAASLFYFCRARRYRAQRQFAYRETGQFYVRDYRTLTRHGSVETRLNTSSERALVARRTPIKGGSYARYDPSSTNK